MASTVRVDLRAALVVLLDAYVAANPTQLARTFTTRPPSAITDRPYAFVDLGPEEASYDNSIRTRKYAPGFVVVDDLSSNPEAVTRMDLIVDGLVDTLTANPHLIAGSSWSNQTVTEVTEADGTYSVRVAIADFEKPEGRN